MSTSKSKSYQIGLTDNPFTLTAKDADGQLKLLRGIADSTKSSTVLTIDSSNNVILNSGALTTNTTATSSYTGFKNQIINGNFDYWQRATTISATATTRYETADRWVFERSGQTSSSARTAFAIGQTTVPNNPRYYVSNTTVGITSTANYYTAMTQRIEDVTKLSGKTVTLSFWLMCPVSKNFSVDFIQNFGTGGSPSTSVTGIGAKRFSSSPTWTKYTLTTTLPSVSGKTLGTTANTSYLGVRFWFSANTNNALNTAALDQILTADGSVVHNLAQIQLEEGSSATDFENRTPALELSLCQRYYYTMPNPTRFTLRSFSSTSAFSQSILHPVPMVNSPSVTKGLTSNLSGGGAASLVMTVTTSSTSVRLSGSGNTMNTGVAMSCDIAGIQYDAEI